MGEGPHQQDLRSLDLNRQWVVLVVVWARHSGGLWAQLRVRQGGG